MNRFELLITSFLSIFVAQIVLFQWKDQEIFFFKLDVNKIEII